jgi:glycosyltransferase involved in cell wall biosynthesis
MKLLLSHPTGNANVRAVATGLAKANLLTAFYTALAVFKGRGLYRVGNLGLFSELHRRQFDTCLEVFTHIYPYRELGRMIASKQGWNRLVEREKGMFSIDVVYQSLDKHIACQLLRTKIKASLMGVYGYEDGAAFTFEEAKRLELKCFYDLPTGYWRASRKLLTVEIERCPEWAETFTGFKDSSKKLERKDKELALADVVIVASKFTADTLKEYPGKLPPVVIIPYGFPPAFENREYEGFEKKRRLKLLFVGKLTQQKGIADLFEAIKGLEKLVELTIVGHKSANIKILDDELAKHNYIPTLPHHEILKLMRAQDVLVFPSLFDGFGMVITEAMSQGTPVIASERSAGPDLIRHGENGWLIKAGSPLSLRKIIEELIENPDSIEKAGRVATESARQRTWEIYGKEMALCIGKILEERP